MGLRAIYRRLVYYPKVVRAPGLSLPDENVRITRPNQARFRIGGVWAADITLPITATGHIVYAVRVNRWVLL